MTIKTYLHCLVPMMFLLTGMASAQIGTPNSVTHEDIWDAQTLRMNQLVKASSEISTLLSRPMPEERIANPDANLKQQRVAWNEQTAWITSVQRRINGYLEELNRLHAGNGNEVSIETLELTNRQFLSLQEATQMESRKFQNATGHVRTRHNSIIAILIGAKLLTS